MKQILLGGLILFATQLFAQGIVPAGTVLPVQLNSSLRSDKAKAGERVSGRVMQDVPLPGGGKIHAGAKVIGQIVSSEATKTGKNAAVCVRFDTLATGKHRVAMTTNLRAMATMMDVSEAQVPESGPDRGTSENLWTTKQIGGDVVYRGAMVTEGSTVVGNSALGSGVLVEVKANREQKCRGPVAGNEDRQALWVFSANACGLYNLPHMEIVHAGRTAPLGEIELASDKGEVKVPAGSGMLLRVNGSEPRI